MFKDRPMPTFMAKKMFERHSKNKLGGEFKILNSGIIKPGYHILDIGCGPGHLSIEMALLTGETGEVYALDIHPLAIKCVNDLIASNGIKNIKTILTRILETGLPDNSIDLIFIFNAYDMIRNKKKLHNEIQRVLKPNGRLFINNNKHRLPRSNKFKKELFDKDEFMSYDYHDKSGSVYKKSN